MIRAAFGACVSVTFPFKMSIVAKSVKWRLDGVSDDRSGAELSTDARLARRYAREKLIEDARSRVVNLLGACSYDGQETAALLLMEKTHFSPQFLDTIETGLSHAFSRIESIGQNDIYTWVFGWQAASKNEQADVKMTLICPATDELIAKYSTPERRMVLETPHMYRTVTKPWIDMLPTSKTAWVRNILQGISEQESILYNDDDPKAGFILLPDMKWDRRSLSSLYLVAIVRDESLKTLRDLRKEHIPLLRNIQTAGAQIARDTFGLPPASTDGSATPLRCFLHYMPTYFHLHVHLLSANFTSHPGALVGQAHLLEDVISLLELGVSFSDRTLGYAMADGHPLLHALQEAGYAK